MEHTEFIAAIDLGSSKITGVVGRKIGDSVVSILACQSEPSRNNIRRGLVFNIAEVGGTVKRIKTMLENAVHATINKVYVSLAGQSLHTVEHTVSKTLSAGDIVTEDIINQLNESAGRHVHPDPSKRIFGIADVEYVVDGRPEQNPIGITGSKVEGRFTMIAGRDNMLDTFSKSVREKTDMRVAGSLVGALATAAIALNEEEKMLGCALINFGGGTTTVSVYKGGILHKMTVIPFGGKNITNDICALNFSEEKAEEMKVKYGTAGDSRAKAKSLSTFVSPFSSKPKADFTEMNNAIKLRLDEIIANIDAQIKQSGYYEQLGAGLVITGGASQLSNLDQYLAEKFNMPVRKASAKSSFINNKPECVNDPALTQALGMLLLGTENCALASAIEEPVEAPPTKKADKKTDKKDGIKTKVGNMVGGLFDGLNNFFDESEERKKREE